MNFGTFQGAGNPALYKALSMPARIEQMIAASQTWVAPVTGNYIIFAVGAGGSGAAKTANTGFGIGNRATGGGAGGLAIKSAFLTAGTSSSLSRLARGARAFPPPTTGTAAALLASLAAAFRCNAGGGSGGTHAELNQNTVTTNGAAGGTASGGDWNFTGGSGGNATTQMTTDGNGAAYSGGGAVAW
jgi:hypothetical protein